MRLRPGIQTKKLSETEVGEWIRVDLPSGPSLAWIVGLQPPIGRDLVSFHIGGDVPPTLRIYTGDLTCISFGSECVLEPVATHGEFADGQSYREQAGTLLLTSNGAFLTVKEGRNQWSDAADINIETGDVLDHPVRSPALFAHWRLWASEAERASVKGEPLLEFRATPRPPQ